MPGASASPAISEPSRNRALKTLEHRPATQLVHLEGVPQWYFASFLGELKTLNLGELLLLSSKREYFRVFCVGILQAGQLVDIQARCSYQLVKMAAHGLRRSAADLCAAGGRSSGVVARSLVVPSSPVRPKHHCRPTLAASSSAQIVASRQRVRLAAAAVATAPSTTQVINRGDTAGATMVLEDVWVQVRG